MIAPEIPTERLREYIEDTAPAESIGGRCRHAEIRNPAWLCPDCAEDHAIATELLAHRAADRVSVSREAAEEAHLAIASALRPCETCGCTKREHFASDGVMECSECDQRPCSGDFGIADLDHPTLAEFRAALSAQTDAVGPSPEEGAGGE